MSKKVIDEILAAEEMAKEIRRKADTYAKALFERAERESKRLYTDALERARSESECEKEKASAEARAKIDGLRANAYSEAAKMTEQAEKNMKKAVDLIVDRILNA